MLAILEILADLFMFVESPIAIYFTLLIGSLLGIIFGPFGGDSRAFFTGVFFLLVWIGFLVKGSESNVGFSGKFLLTLQFIAGCAGLLCSMSYYAPYETLVTVRNEETKQSKDVSPGFHFKGPFTSVTKTPLPKKL